MKSLLLVFLPLQLAVAQAPAYHIIHTWPLGGAGRWDYLTPDPANHRVFVARENRLMVVDERDGHLIGEVTGINGAHGVALVPRAHHDFATSGNDSSVVMFDPVTFKVLGRTHAAEDADAMVYDPHADRIFTFNGDAHSSTVIDPSGHLVTNIDLGGKPESGAVAEDGRVYVNLVEDAQVVEIDAAKLTVTRRWSTAPCRQPVAMAIDTVAHRLFSGCRSGVLAVSDYRAGRVVATAPIGAGVDGTDYDPTTHDIFTSNADGTLTVIHQDAADRYHVSQTIATPVGSKNMGLDPTMHLLYLATAQFQPVTDSMPAGARRRPPMVPGSFSVIVVGQ